MQEVTYNHHAQSIENMIKHYREDPEIKALFLIGSVATRTERPDSDLDAVAIVSEECFNEKKKDGGLEEVVFGKCTYQGGYFNTHFLSPQELEHTSRCGSEPMRNMLSCFRVLFCDDDRLVELAAAVPVFQQAEAEEKKLRFYCNMKMFYTYFWVVCKPEGFMLHHTANGIVYNLYRLILLENQILFPSVRKLEEYVIRAPKKPENIVEKCRSFLKSLSDEDCVDIINSYEMWTSYDFPKNSDIIMNTFSNPYEWN